MGVIMALDVGEKTIGVAFSDENEQYAFPHETIWRQEGYKRDMATLRELVAERQVGEIVVGLPLLLDGSRGIQAEKIEQFVASLRGSVRIPIRLQDERLSTSEAERQLIASDRKRGERKRDIDSIAASLILETYLRQKQTRDRSQKTEEEKTTTQGGATTENSMEAKSPESEAVEGIRMEPKRPTATRHQEIRAGGVVIPDEEPSGGAI